MRPSGFDEEAAAAAVKQLLAAFPVDESGHTDDTPARAARGWAEMLSGYETDPGLHLAKTFPGTLVPNLIIVSGIQVHSTCAHHLLPFTGLATVAYLPRPNQEIVGLSKLARVVDGYARRLQVQERIGSQVTQALALLQPEWAVCAISATHECMRLRGVCESSSQTTTVATLGDPGPMLAEILAQHRADLR